MPIRRLAFLALLALASLLVLALGAAGPAFAAFAPHGLWEATVGEPLSNDSWSGVAAGPDGSAYVAGTFGQAWFPATGDIVVARYGAGDAAASLTWMRRWDDPGAHGADIGVTLAVDKKGAVVVAGFSADTTGFYGWRVIKWSASGAQKWAASFPAPLAGSNAFARDVAVDSSGDVYVCGSETYGPGDPSGDDVALVVRKLSGSTGALLWEARYTGPAAGYNAGDAIALDPAGNAYVTGYGDGTGETTDMVLAKYAHADGRKVWLRRIDGPDGADDEGITLAVTGAGVWMVGRAWSTADDTCRVLLVRYTLTGKRSWLRTWAEAPDASSYGDALAVDAAGNAVVAGSSNPSVVTWVHALLLRYSAKGKLLWSRVTYDEAQPYAEWRAVACLPKGDIWVGGDVKVVAGRWDWAVARYSPTGTARWTSRWESPADHNAGCMAIALGKTGVLTAGRISSSGDTQAILAKYKR